MKYTILILTLALSFLTAKDNTTYIKVDGMQCSYTCVGKVNSVMQKIDGVKECIVDFDKGLKSVTKFKLLGSYENFSFVLLSPVTGRTHQLRVHLSELGYPILGDKKYDSKENPINRTAVHLRKISFTHPATEKLMEFETKVPEDFLKIFRHNFYR